MAETDSEIVDRVRGGERDAYRWLVERYSRRVFRLAFRITGSEADAEEVVQEAFLRAYRSLDRYDGRASFGTWITRIATNFGLDIVRVRKRYVSPPEERIQPDTGPGQERLLLSKQIRDRLDSTLASLSEKERAAFVLRHFEGLSIAEAGEALGMSEGATKHSVFRAVRKLRHALAPLVPTAPTGVWS